MRGGLPHLQHNICVLFPPDQCEVKPMFLFFYKLIPGECEGRPEAMLTCLPEEDDAHYDEAIVCELPLIAGEDADGRSVCTLVLPEQIDGYPLTALEDFMPEEEWAEGEGQPPVITGLSLPAGLRRIQPDALEWMSRLEHIEVAPDNPVFKAVDGILYHRQEARLVRCPPRRPGSLLMVPEGTRSIGENGLAGCRELRCLLLPEGLERLERYAVAGCGQLEYISLPESLQSMENGCLMHCTALPWVRVPRRVSRIGDGAFLECTALLGLSLAEDSALTTLGDHAFRGCTALGAVTLPAGLSAVPGRCFAGCTGLRRVTFHTGPEGTSAIRMIDYEAFRGCTALEALELPEGLTTIAQYAFTGCTALRRVVLPATLESVIPGSRVANGMPFGGCHGLEQIILREGNPHFLIHDGALIGLEHSRLIVYPAARRESRYAVPEYIRIIGVEAFSHCEALRQVILPDGLETIENGAFSDCTALAAPELPASLSRIGQGAFNGCTMLEAAVLPEGIRGVSRNAYAGCTALRRVVLPGTVKQLEYGAFEGCTALEEIMLPEGLHTLGNRVFRGCTALRRLVLPRSLSSIDMFMNTFEGCPLQEVLVPRDSYADSYFQRFYAAVKRTHY